MNSIDAILKKLAQDRFYGSVEIKFEAGNPVLMRKSETLTKLTLSANPNRENRGQHVESNLCR